MQEDCPHQRSVAAEANIAASARLYACAKASIGEANRSVLPSSSKYLPPVVLSADFVRARKSVAFHEMDQRLAVARAAFLALAN